MEKASSQGHIHDMLHQVVVASRPGCQTEIEDFLRPEFYCPVLSRELRLSFDDDDEGKRNAGIMSHGRDEWSHRLTRVCEVSGISVDKETIAHLKAVVSEELRCYKGDLSEVFYR